MNDRPLLQHMTRRALVVAGTEGGTMSVHILYTPMKEISRKSIGEKWCFICRKRREFVYIISAPIVTSINDTGAYYGPTHQIECTICGTTDSDCFPGTEREWN